MEASAPPSTPAPPPTASPVPPHPRSRKTPYLVMGLLALPGLLGLTGNSELAAFGALLLAPLCALASGIILGLRIGQTPGTRFLLSCVLIVACLAVAEGLAIAGCGLSNPKFNFH